MLNLLKVARYRFGKNKKPESSLFESKNTNISYLYYDSAKNKKPAGYIIQSDFTWLFRFQGQSCL